MIKVYHDPQPTFSLPERILLRKSYLALVAEVDTDELGEAFELTNTIHQPWWENPRVRFLGSPDYGMQGCRSTSVGDILELKDGTFYAVASVGFQKVMVLDVEDPPKV